jgi:hypothetical protein
MSFDGGFGAAVFVREALINDVVRAMHFRHGDDFRTAISKTLTLAGDSATISGTMFVETPNLTLREVDKKARVALSAWARLRVQTAGVDEECVARLTAELLVPIVLDGVDKGFDQQFLDLSQFEVATAQVGVPWTSLPGGGHSKALAASEDFRKLLLDAVRPLAKKVLRINVPIEKIIQMQASLAAQSLPFVPQVRVQAVKVFDGAIAAGFDVFTGATRETQGDMATLQLPWIQWAARSALQGGSRGDENEVQAIVAIQPAVFLKWGGLNVKFQVQKTPLEDGKRIDDVVLGLARGAATLLVTLTNIHDDPLPDDHIAVLASIVPMGDFISITGTEVVFNTSALPGLIDLLGGLITDYVRSVVKDKVAGVALKANWALASAKYNGPLPGAEGAPGRALARVSPAATAIDPEFVLSGIHANISRGKPPGTGFDDPADDANVLPSTPVLSHRPPPPFKFRIRQGQDSAYFWPIRVQMLSFEHSDHPTLRRDPSLRTVWSVTVRRQDESIVHFSQDLWSDDPGARILTMDLWSLEYYLSSHIDLRCVHYRLPSEAGAALASAVPERIYIEDRFRRDFPFARWHRDIAWFEMVDGERVVKSKLRESAVHKTDIRQRCQFCDVGGKTRAFSSAEQTQHLASLPAPDEAGFRMKLCPFCFPAG